MNKNNLTHDEFFKRIFSDVAGVRTFLSSNLPAYIKEDLDLSQLEQVSETFISSDLRSTISDVVFKVPLKDGSSSVYISFLIEHKSHPDKHVLVQIGGYIFSSYQKQINNKEPLSLVIPILFYHGREKWEYQLMESLFPNVKEEWKKFIPSINYIYNNINELSDEEIESLNDRFLVASILALKHIWNRDWLEENVGRLLMMTTQDKSRIQESLIFYIFKRYKFGKDFLTSLPEPAKSDVMNTFDILYEDAIARGVSRGIEKGFEKGIEQGIEKGIEQGIEKGIEQGIQKGIERGKEEIVLNLINSGDFSISKIASLTGVPESLVKKLWESRKKS